MFRRIRILDRVTIDKIAAGEVVESPSSVVKELVENSIDASATSVIVHVDKGGTGRIMVIDDGTGMSRDDAEIAFTRHSTSKIEAIDDLLSLSTLGFRGEALASISAVSNVEMLTRSVGSNEEKGTRIVVSAGRMEAIEDVGCPVGTRVTVTDLFENVPARKKFLRSAQAEKARCLDVFQRLMLINPHISFKLVMDGEERLSGRSTDDLRMRAAEIFGVKTAKGMIEITKRKPGPVTVSGLISLPWDTRSNSAGITISVDGRVVKNKQIIESIRRGYGSRLMKGRFPIAVVFLDLEGSMVDANVHPTKDIVKFANEAAIMNQIESMVSAALFSKKSGHRDGKIVHEEKTTSRIQTPASKETGKNGLRSPYLERAATRTNVDRRPRQIPLMEDEVRPQEGAKGPWDQVPEIEGMDRLPPQIPEDNGKKRIRIIGQLDRSYILCEIGADLLLVDQHAAHERIRLEDIKRRHVDGKAVTQELLNPVRIELDPSSMANLRSMEKDLSDIGFDLEVFGEDMVTVRGLPRFMGRMEGHEVLRDMASDNEYHEGCSYPDDSFKIELPIKERLISLAACRGAIKAHHSLSLKEMEDLIEDLLKCDVPLHCAHGRPTMVRLPLRVLEKWFKRVL